MKAFRDTKFILQRGHLISYKVVLMSYRQSLHKTMTHSAPKYSTFGNGIDCSSGEKQKQTGRQTVRSVQLSSGSRTDYMQIKWQTVSNSYWAAESLGGNNHLALERTLGPWISAPSIQYTSVGGVWGGDETSAKHTESGLRSRSTFRSYGTAWARKDRAALQPDRNSYRRHRDSDLPTILIFQSL